MLIPSNTMRASNKGLLRRVTGCRGSSADGMGVGCGRDAGTRWRRPSVLVVGEALVVVAAEVGVVVGGGEVGGTVVLGAGVGVVAAAAGLAGVGVGLAGVGVGAGVGEGVLFVTGGAGNPGGIIPKPGIMEGKNGGMAGRGVVPPAAWVAAICIACILIIYIIIMGLGGIMGGMPAGMGAPGGRGAPGTIPGIMGNIGNGGMPGAGAAWVVVGVGAGVVEEAVEVVVEVEVSEVLAFLFSAWKRDMSDMTHHTDQKKWYRKMFHDIK